MELQGSIYKLNNTETFASGFQKKTIILHTQEQYPQYIPIEFLGDKIDLLTNFSKDEVVKVYININGRLWTNKEGEEKCFGSIVGWKIEKLDESNTSKPSETPSKNTYANAGIEKNQPSQSENPFADEESDDTLPF